MEIIGTWEFSKLEALMKSGNMFDHDFFKSGKFNAYSDEDKLDLFADFIGSWADFLTTNKLSEEGDFVLKISSQLRSRGPHVQSRFTDSGVKWPEWYMALPHHLKPPQSKVSALENLRKKLQLSDEAFMIGISISPWAVICTQETTLERFRRQFPEYSERDLWRAVILSRFEVKLKTPSLWDPPTEVILKKMGAMDEIMKDIHSWQDTLDFILEMEKDSFSIDPTGIQNEINEVLSS